MKKNQGFYGKGFKFDETEAQLAAERKKLQKAALGLQDSDEEDAGVDVSFFFKHCLHAANDYLSTDTFICVLLPLSSVTVNWKNVFESM